MGAGDRVCFRLKARFPVLYKGPNDTRWIKALSADLSTSGMGILARHSIEKNSVIDLRLKLPWHPGKILLRGRVVHQMHSSEKSSHPLVAGIRFEEVPENVLDTITKFISRRLGMIGVRVFVLLTGLAAFAVSLLRFIYYSMLGLFQGTAFGREWLTGNWATIPLDLAAYYYAAMAVLVLVTCFCFFSMKRRASLVVLSIATVGLLDQGIRWTMKIPYLWEDMPSAWIFLAETGALALWGSLVAAMILHGKDYEHKLGLMHEDRGFTPASPEPPPKEPPPPVSRVFLP